MSETLKVRWILKYFTDIAQTYGGNLLNVPESTKSHRVQVIQFITYPRDDHPDDIIWARISDKEFSVPVKFTTEAVSNYNGMKNIYADPTLRLTKRRYALGTIGRFKPFFARIPLVSGGLDSVERLALEVNFVNLIGADGEGLFGDPKELEVNEDMRAWCEGLRKGGGDGNILKEATDVVKLRLERARSRTTVSISDNTVISSLEEASKDKTTFVNAQADSKATTSVTETSDQANTCRRARSGQKLQKEVDPLKAWRKSWRVMDVIWPHIIDIPQEVELEHMQILKFGQDARRGSAVSFPHESATESILDAIQGAEEKRSQEIEEIAIRKGIPERVVKASENAKSVTSFNVTPRKEKKDKSPNPPAPRIEPTTPSIWAPSDEEDEDVIERELTPSLQEAALDGRQDLRAPDQINIADPNASFDYSSNQISRRDEDDREVGSSGTQRMTSQTPPKSHSPIEEVESSLKEPTPAQRRVQAVNKPLFPFHRNKTHSAPPDTSQPPGPPHSQLHSHSELHSSHSDSGIIADTSMSFDMSQARRYGVGQLARANAPNFHYPQRLFTDQKKEAPEKERGPPKILVPDSDVSGGMSQLGHSQSQSQSQKKSQTQSDSSRSQPLLPSQVQNIRVPVSPSLMATRPGLSGARGDPELVNNKMDADSQSIPSNSDPSKENAPNRASGKPIVRSQSTSQTQTDSQQSVDDPFYPSLVPNTSGKKEQSANNESKNSRPIPPLSRLSQGSEDGGRALKDAIDDPHAEEEAQAEINEMDVDDARTHAMLSSSAHRRLDRDTKPAETSRQTSKDKQFIIKGRTESSKPLSIRGEHGEQLGKASKTASSSPSSSPPQSSPSAHLGKRPRSSSISIQSSLQSSPSVFEARRHDHADKSDKATSSSNMPARKKVRLPSPSSGEYAVQHVQHEPQAWREASFLKSQGQREKEGQGQSRSNNTITKFSSATRIPPSDVQESRTESLGRMLSNHKEAKTYAASGRKRASTDHPVKSRSPTSASALYSNPISHMNLAKNSPRQSAADSRPGTNSSRAGNASSRDAAKKPLWSQNAREAAGDRLPRSKEESSSASSSWRSDFTLLREPGGPKWINWVDIQGILLKVGRLRHKESQALMQ